MLTISPLFSGSKGNCTLIQSDTTNILLDAGYSCRSIVRALELRGLTQKDIDAIIITHEHADHIAALPQWQRRVTTLVYAPEPIADFIQQRVYFAEVHAVTGEFSVGNIRVDTYKCSHDANCCFGYRFTVGSSSLACVTDTGCVTEQLIHFLVPCKAVMIESNHDVNMLQRGEYPFPLKRRILSSDGHLSNEQAAEVITQIATGNVKDIILAHLSEQNNTKEIAFATAVRALANIGVCEGKDVRVCVADQYKNEVTICLD